MEINIKKEEVLRYLGYQGAQYDEPLEALINSCMLRMRQAVRPKSVTRRFLLQWGNQLRLETGFALVGEDIRRHLDGCESAALLAATLGGDADRLIRAAQVTDMATAVILDACATAAIEQVCDAAENAVGTQARAEEKFITWRFSPGYGDLPLDSQKEWVRLLDAPRKIGLTVTESHILIPKKSVTAIIGISNKAIAGARKSCESCSMAGRCRFRNSGGHCQGA